LADTRADMQSFAKEQEIFNEELQNANEEVVSSNEELQSVNEELETSKEEIESTNEELITTNQELETRNELLNESYGYSEAIINTIHEPMLILDKDLRVKSANKSFYNNFQVTEEETERTLLFDLGNKQWDIPRLRKLLEEIIPKNTRFHDFAVNHAFKGIGNKTMLLNASRIVQKGHGEQLILLAINDITEHALLQLKEKELLKKEAIESKSYSMKLEQAVEARTKELEQVNKTLAEKNSELEKMNSELESFAYVSSHDLQEPLRKIQTFASRILETENQNLSEKGKDYFSRMQNASLRMKRLIEDLLAFSSLSIADRKFETTDLNKIVTEVKMELKETIEEKNAIIEAVELRKVNIIPFQFRQLMYNLINNSLKFAHPDVRPHVVIKSVVVEGSKLDRKQFSSSQKYCHISVTDNGIGFDPQYKERIFEVFQKLHGKQEYAGTGIGLAIVKKVVENHNGIVTVTSKLNKGATFNIYIPVAG
jgi:two-component system CheB/CheR fusion protein